MSLYETAALVFTVAWIAFFIGRATAFRKAGRMVDETKTQAFDHISRGGI